MFKIVTMMVIFSTGIKAFAFMPLPLKCWNENHQTLEVFNSGFRADVSSMDVVYLKFFNGEATQVLKGIDKSNLEENEVLLPLGDSLQVVTPRFHGGRCGRCAPSDELSSVTNYFAKLTLESEVYSFQCTSL